MIFAGDKCSLVRSNSDRFNANDFVQLVQVLMSKEKRPKYPVAEARAKVAVGAGKYGWLSSRRPLAQLAPHDLAELSRLASKLSPARCATVAIRLDELANADTHREMAPEKILTLAKKFLEIEFNCQLIAQKNNSRTTGADSFSSKYSKVAPELFPPGRVPIVSFLTTPDYRIFSARRSK